MRILIQAQGNAPSRYVAVSCDIQNFIRNIKDCEVLTFGYNEGVDILIKPEDPFQKVVQSLPQGWTPDFCLLWQAEWNLLSAGIESAPFPIAAYISDWDYDIPLTRTIVETADITIVEGDFDEKALLAMGANKVLNYYVLGVMEDFIDPSPRKIRDREYDLSYTVMIDNKWYADKSRFILDLCSLPDKYNILIRKPTGSYREYISLLRSSKLVLSHVRRGLMSIRTLEAGAQGTVCLNTGAEVNKHFASEAEYIPVSHDNFISQIEKYLNNEKKLQAMSEKVRAGIVEKYESGKRFKELAGFVKEKLEGLQTQRRFNRLTKSEQCIRRGEIYYYTFFRSVASGYRFKNMERQKFPALAVEEFRKAIAIERSPRGVTDSAVAEASFNFLFNREKITGSTWDRVITMLKEVISSHPKYIMAFYNLGLLYFRLGRRNEALRVFYDTLQLLQDENSDLDPWCLQTYDLDLFNSILQKPLNENLLLSFTEEERALRNIKGLYQSAIFYYIFIIGREHGDIYKALEAVLEASALNPECGLIARKASETLALLGNEEESLVMYRKSVEIMPLDIDLRKEYIKTLYVYGKDRKAVEEIRKIMMLIKRVSMLSEKSVSVNEMISKFTRFNPSSPYSHDTCKEYLLYQWLDFLYDCLRRVPQNSALVLRIVDIWNKLEREEKVFEILEQYISNCKMANQFDNTALSLIDNVYDYLREASVMKNRKAEERLGRLKGLISNVRAAAGN